ncbi:protein LOW PSII ACCUMULATION 1, chloroplastic isoform X1 [Dendrobium catenatum]|uniref:protein LOW PSII ACCUMULATION 1, chloroplastic isoform X1 n=1 Tax=Dendrobium catenatum TaxID=906689 RepID=UPI0009F245AC|nr:protein LOW PSII ACCUMULATION 1, chloroplastic isoform X1 [Dendrobium catenatum]
MAAVTPISLFILSPNYNPSHEAASFRSKAFLQRSDLLASSHSLFCIHPSLVFRSRLLFRIATSRQFSCVNCSAENKPSPSSDISSTAKIRSEVLSPFRSVRMFFYIAFIASGALGGLITITRLISSLANPSKTLLLPEILKDLSIDLGAVFLFYFLYARENEAKNVQLAKLFREESLSQLKLRIDQKKIVPINDLRGIARLVILAGPAAYINESFKLSEAFTEGLLERGVLVVPFATDKSKLEFESVDCKEQFPIDEKRKKLWQLRPVNVAEWSNWIDEQKKLATVSLDSPVYVIAQGNDANCQVFLHAMLEFAYTRMRNTRYLSLRMDGRVRGSGVGYPPWNAFVAQLPPVKGLWSGILDGMDGRVL